MLKRVHKIKNIGRFVDYHEPGCEFFNETIIFGLNTQGKSTITALLRSIQTGNNNILIGRKTFGVTGSKNIEIDFDENGVVDKYIFQNRTWNKTNKNILIFDSKFIAENVFDGESISFDQQKNLNAVIIGKKGQDLNIEIASLQNKSEEFANKKRDKTLEFNRHFPHLNIETFKFIKKDEKIDDKIKIKEKEIKFEKDKGEIKRIVKSNIQIISSIDFSIKNTLKKTLNLKQEEIEDHIRGHFSSEKNARNFIKDGLGFLKNKPTDGSKRSCVFCGQELENKSESLIDLYAAFFKGGYEQLQNEIITAIDYFRGINVEAILTKLVANLKARDIDIGLDDSEIAKIAELKKEFERELSKKRDLNYTINFDSFDKLNISIKQIKGTLDNLEKTKFDVVSSKTLQELENEKKIIENIKTRHNSSWTKFFDELTNIEIEAEKIRTLREEKRSELETHSRSIFNAHKDMINGFCREMNADFEIDDFKPLKKIVGTSERIFAIKFFGMHKVLIDNLDDAHHNFKNTLSESDKRLLAFAFFLSILYQDRELDKKIIVFDDPVSSFDSERRRKTAQLIADITCKYKEQDGTEKILYPKQKIILTHEDRFAKKLSKIIPGAQTLKIKEYVDNGQKGSTIAHADFDQDFPDDDISQCIEKIKSALDSRQFNVSFEKDCRIVLEHIFKRKYCLNLKEEILQKKSIRTFTQKLKEKGVGGFNNQTKFQKFIRLCDDLNIELHDNAEENSNGDKESILKDFFECLGEI